MIRAKSVGVNMFDKGLPADWKVGLLSGIVGMGLGDIANTQSGNQSSTASTVGTAIGAGLGTVASDYIGRQSANRWLNSQIASGVYSPADALLQSTEKDYINHLSKGNARAKLIGLQLLASLGAPITGALIGGMIGKQ